MDEVFIADRLRSDEARAAFALVTLRLPHLDFADWASDVRRKSLGGSRAGFIAVRDVRGVFHAIYHYRTRLAYGKRQWLEISEPIVANLPGSPVERVVAHSIDRIAAESGCDEISVNVIVRPAKGISMGTSVLDATRAAQSATRLRTPGSVGSV